MYQCVHGSMYTCIHALMYLCIDGMFASVSMYVIYRQSASLKPRSPKSSIAIAASSSHAGRTDVRPNLNREVHFRAAQPSSTQVRSKQARFWPNAAPSRPDIDPTWSKLTQTPSHQARCWPNHEIRPKIGEFDNWPRPAAHPATTRQPAGPPDRTTAGNEGNAVRSRRPRILFLVAMGVSPVEHK